MKLTGKIEGIFPGTDRRLLAAQKRADEQKWTRRREDALQEKLDAVTAERNMAIECVNKSVELVFFLAPKLSDATLARFVEETARDVEKHLATVRQEAIK